MKAYGLKWWFATGKKMKQDGRNNKRMARKSLANAAFQLGWWLA